MTLTNMHPAVTLLASKITPSPEWPTTHCCYQFADGTWLSVADDGTLRPGITNPLSGETFVWKKGESVATAVRSGVGWSFYVAASL